MGQRMHRVCLAVLLLNIGASGGRAAHEWRGAWASPQPLVAAEEHGTIFQDAGRVSALCARPYGIADLSFTAVRARNADRSWEAHAALLRATGYCEWHAGGGRTFHFGEQVSLLAGVRVFGLTAPPLETAPSVRATLLARMQPHLLRALSLEIGVIDFGGGGGQDIAPLITQRCSLSGGGASLWVERVTESGDAAETVLMVSFLRGRIGFAQGYRWLVGEMSTMVLLRSPPLQLRVGERWHPELGRTPYVAVDWLGGGS